MSVSKSIRFFLKFIRYIGKNGGICLFKFVVNMQPNSKYIENNYENSNDNLNQHTDE